MDLAVLDHGEDILKSLKRVGFPIVLFCQSLEKAASGAGMPGRSDLMNLCQDGIIVAVQMQGLHILEMSGGFPL